MFPFALWHSVGHDIGLWLGWGPLVVLAAVSHDEEAEG